MNTPPRHLVVAFLLFLGCWVVHSGYEFAAPLLRAEAWNMGGALGRALLLLVVLAYRSPFVAWASAWWVVEEVQVVACGAAWVFKPWPVPPGANRCSALVGVPLELVGLGVAAMALWRMYLLTKAPP